LLSLISKKSAILLIILSVLLIKAEVWLNNGFKAHKIMMSAGGPSYISSEEPDILGGILSQPFRFLARGRQSYVFESADGKYVLKAFRTHRIHSPFWARILRWKNPNGKRYRNWITSYRLADKQLREETGIVYVHFQPTRHFKKCVHLIDRLGRGFWIDLDWMGFLIQRKYQLLNGAFLKERPPEEVREYISAFVETVAHRCQKGIVNRNLHSAPFKRNLGVEGGRVIELDVGQFSMNEKLKDHEKMRAEMVRYSDHFRSWLEKENPEVVAHFDSEISKF